MNQGDKKETPPRDQRPPLRISGETTEISPAPDPRPPTVPGPQANTTLHPLVPPGARSRGVHPACAKETWASGGPRRLTLVSGAVNCRGDRRVAVPRGARCGGLTGTRLPRRACGDLKRMPGAVSLRIGSHVSAFGGSKLQGVLFGCHL
jgi:hypothetical protein